MTGEEIQRRLVDGRWATSVEMRQPDRGPDEESITLPFTAKFATAPVAAAAALEAAIIWIDRADSRASRGES